MTDEPISLRWTWAVREEEDFSQPHVTFVALLIGSRANEDNSVWFTRDWLSRKTGLHLSTVKRDLAELKRKGYLTGTNIGGRGKAGEYLLTLPERGSERGSQRGSRQGSLKGFTHEPPGATTGATTTRLGENGSRNGDTAVHEHEAPDPPSDLPTVEVFDADALAGLIVQRDEAQAGGAWELAHRLDTLIDTMLDLATEDEYATASALMTKLEV